MDLHSSPRLDPRYLRRLALALAASLFIHAVIIGLAPLHALPVRDDRTPATRVVLEVRTPPPVARPRPTPPPTPRPRPTIALATPRPVPRRVRSASRTPAQAASLRGGSRAPKVVAKLVPSAPPNGVAAEAGAGIAPGGAGSGAGPGAGSGGASGTASPAPAPPAADQPCGSVTFVPEGASAQHGGAWYETIRVTISFRDGHAESGTFPYPFVYANEAADPWSPPNLTKDIAVPAQLPPPGTDLSGADRAVVLTLQYTNQNGRTTLPPCPAVPAATP